tara:strand:+ start:11996 stop:14455 length:2460 start_codon:yes stop_codon:yes gene_type:complete
MVKLEDYTLTELRKLASKFNKKVKLPAYSKKTKSDLIQILRNHPELNIIEGGDKLKMTVIKSDFNPELKVSKKSTIPKLKVSKTELNKKIKEKVTIKKTIKGIEVQKKDGKIHTEKEVKILKKTMPTAIIKVEGKKLVIKPKKEAIKKINDFNVKEIKKVFDLDINPKKLSFYIETKNKLKPLTEKILSKGFFDLEGNYTQSHEIDKNKLKNILNKMNNNRIKVEDFYGKREKGTEMKYIGNDGMVYTINLIKYSDDVVYIYNGKNILPSTFKTHGYADKKSQLEYLMKLEKSIIKHGENQPWKNKYLEFVKKYIQAVQENKTQKEPPKKPEPKKGISLKQDEDERLEHNSNVKKQYEISKAEWKNIDDNKMFKKQIKRLGRGKEVLVKTELQKFPFNKSDDMSTKIQKTYEFLKKSISKKKIKEPSRKELNELLKNYGLQIVDIDYYKTLIGDIFKKKKEEKKEVVKKPIKKESPKQEPPKKAIIKKAPQVGSQGYVENYKDLTKAQQMQILLKQTIKPSIKKQSDFKALAKEFYNQINEILSKSSSRAIKKLLDFGLSPEELTQLFGGKSKGVEFYPTPKECVLKLVEFEKCPRKILEGTAGIGSVVNGLYNYYLEKCGNDIYGTFKDDFQIVANERELKYVNVMKKFLPYEAQQTGNIKIMNEDFFDLPLKNNYDMIFLNPPFDRKVLYKFLFRGIQMINNSKSKHASLMFISPGLTDITGKSSSIDNYYLGNIIKGYNEKGTIPPKKFVEIVNELSNNKITIQNLDDYIEDELDYESKEYETINQFDFLAGQGIGLCEGFGGTGTRAVMSVFQAN